MKNWFLPTSKTRPGPSHFSLRLRSGGGPQRILEYSDQKESISHPMRELAKGNPGPCLVQVIEDKLEILVVTKSIGLSFEDFDLVIGTFERARGYTMSEIAEKTLAMTIQCLGEFLELIDAQRLSLLDPVIQKTRCCPFIKAPKGP